MRRGCPNCFCYGHLNDRHRVRRPALHVIAARLFDLHPIARSHYYHPAQNGSWSIKAVLPTIAPDLDYANLGNVADGRAAQLAYLEVAHRDTAEERRDALAEALRAYCRRDTEGMLRTRSTSCLRLIKLH